MSLYEKLGIKSFEEMTDDTLQAIVDSKVGITNTAVGSVVRTIIEAILENVDVSNYYAAYVYDALSIDTATGDDLDGLISIFGITRRQPTKAVGVVTFSTGDEPYAYDISIPYGHEISTRQGSDGVIYTYLVNEEDVILPAGQTSIDVEVIAEASGHQYIPAGALSVMGKSIIGIASAVNNAEINGGDDIESDESVRYRTKEYAISFGKATDNALKIAIEGVDGVIRCSIIDLYDGPGTSAAVIVPEVLPPTDDVVNEINKVIAETKAAGIKVSIIYPAIKDIDINITLTTSDIDSSAILEVISNYVNSLGVGQTFVIKQMERKILNVVDVNIIENDDIDITTISPATNITCESDEIIRVNSVTINGVVYNV